MAESKDPPQPNLVRFRGILTTFSPVPSGMELILPRL